jgi:uncharacterized damage-inducible protein DinB
MSHTINDFIQVIKTESSTTFKMLSRLTDESLTVTAFTGGRTLGYLAWHIVLTISEMMNRTGLSVSGPAEDTPEPVTAQEIAGTYNGVVNSLLSEISSKWTDSSLDEEVNMYGEMWKKSLALTALVKHEVHHRGQLSVYMRIAGLSVPGAYGPSKEEWADYGMPPQK